MTRAIFLDRDGVVISDVDGLTRAEDIAILSQVPEALARLRQAGFKLVVVTNQTVIARGLASEDEVLALEAEVERRLAASGASIDAFYFCPHHPSATCTAYRIRCSCRKPRAGLLERAREDLGVDLGRSFCIGDRPSDIAAGRSAGCRTVLVTTGRHTAPPIETDVPLHQTAPDHVCADLAAAAHWITEVAR